MQRISAARMRPRRRVSFPLSTLALLTAVIIWASGGHLVNGVDMRGLSAIGSDLQPQVLGNSRASPNLQTNLAAQSAAETTTADPATSFLELSAQAQSTTRESEGNCEVCVYAVENKQQNQPYLCRGLKDPEYQRECVQVLESLMWWLTNEVYWVNYGCERQSSSGGGVEWVRPCPAHAICSWIEHLYDREPLCPQDPAYPKPK